MIKQLIRDIIEEPWLFVESVISGIIMFGSFYLIYLFAAALS